MSSLQPYMDWEANGPSYLTDNDVEEDAPNTAEDIWHVAIAPDDIKMMSLEQLDDALRLDVISGDTQVWKEGMGDWQPLSVVAGMDDDADETDAGPTHDEPEVVEDEDDEATVMRPFPFPAPGRGAPRAPNPPPRPPTRAPNPPPRSAVRVPSAPPAPRAPSAQPVTLRNASARSAPQARSAPVAPVKTQPRMKAMQPSPAAHVFARPSAPPPAAHVFAPPARSAPPPAMHAFAQPARSAPPPVFAPARPAAGAPYAAAQGFPQAYPAQPQSFASSRPPSPMSLAPNADLGFARSMAPGNPFARPKRRRSSGALYFFLPLALFGGLFAAYRNDLLLQAARAVHQERQYLQLERALVGVPGFGTPRSVAAASALTTDTSTESTTDSTAKTTRDEAPSHAMPSLDTHSAPSQEDHATTPSSAVAKDLAPKAEPKTEAKAVEPTRQFVESKPAPEPRRAAPEPREKAAPSHVAAAPPVSHAAPTRAEPPPPAPKHEVASSTKHESHDVKAAKVVLAESSDDAPTPSARRSKRAAATASASSKAAASFGSLAAHADEDEEPAPKAKPAPKPKAEPKPKAAAAAPPAAAPDPVVSSGNSALDEAIRAAASKKTNKKKPAGADSDPLNGSLD